MESSNQASMMFSPEQSSREVAEIAEMIFDITIESPDLGNPRVDRDALKRAIDRAIKAAVQSLKNDLEGSESTPYPR